MRLLLGASIFFHYNLKVCLAPVSSTMHSSVDLPNGHYMGKVSYTRNHSQFRGAGFEEGREGSMRRSVLPGGSFLALIIQNPSQ